ncbi:MAG: PhoH family protein [Pseudomonadota bacterium]
MSHKTTAPNDSPSDLTASAERAAEQGPSDVLRIAFDDNHRVKDLAGEHDRHLALLEDLLGVRIDPRGNEFAVRGDAVARARAEAALSALYGRLLAGLSVDLSDVRAAARMAPSAPDIASRASREKSVGQKVISQSMQTAPKAAPQSVGVKTPKRMVTPRTKAQERYLAALRDHALVFGVGPAGTGKTYLAVAHAVSRLLSGDVERLILSRPAIEAGERIGFLPGDMKDKVDPYLRPLYDALHDMLPPDYLERRIIAGDIEIAPLAFMRGRTLSRAVVILDEAQNATIAQTKMFLTRLGEGAQMVLTGDPSQSDLPVGDASGLQDAINLLNDMDGVGMAKFSNEDVVRHPLVGRILDRYDARSKKDRAASAVSSSTSKER